MPASKKPRKRMRRCFERDVVRMDEETVAEVTKIFQRTFLAVEMKLHLALCDFDDMACMRDMYNLCTATLALRGHTFDPDFRVEARKAIIEEGFESWLSVYRRGREEDHYVCTGDELRMIRRSFVFIDSIVSDSLEHCPITLMREWFGVRLLMQRHKAGKFHITVAALKKAVQQACIDDVSANYYAQKYRMKLTPRYQLTHNQPEEEK